MSVHETTKIVPTGDRFDIDVANSSGLSLRVRGGVRLDSGFKSSPNATLTLDASSVSYVEVVAATGVISANTSAFTPGSEPLYEVTTNATVITSIKDWRASSGGSAAAGAVAARSEAAALSVNELVYISGWSETYGLPLITKADANAAGKQAQFVMRAALAQNANGMAFQTFRTAANLNTDAAASAGDPVYLSETAGGWTASAPTGASSSVQIVGHVAVKSATVGVVEFDVRDFPTINTDDIQAKAVTAAKIADATITTTQISGTAGITRTQLGEEALAVYGIPAHDLKSNAGAALLAAETAGTFNISVAANVVSVQGEITDNETEVSVGVFQFVLPPEYVAAGDVKVRLKTALIKTGAAVDNASTIDVEVYEQTGNGAVGADLCETAAQSWAAVDTWYTKDFVVTAAGLVAGDILNVKITTNVVDSEVGAGTLRANLDGIAVLLDVKG